VERLLEEIGIPELTLKQVEELCGVAERAAREYILSKLPSRRISVLNSQRSHEKGLHIR